MGRLAYLLDTNIIINYLANRFSESDMHFLDEIVNSIPAISVISKIEILSFNSDENNSNLLRDFINDSNVINLNDEIVENCIILRKEKKIKLPDSIIAATASILNLRLITCDKGFSNIDNTLIMNIK